MSDIVHDLALSPTVNTEKEAPTVDWSRARHMLTRLSAAVEGRGRDENAILRQRAARLATPPPVAEDGRARPYIAFRRGEDRMAVALTALQEVVRPRSVLNLPGVSPHICGVAFNRGEVVAVAEIGWFLAPDSLPTAAPALLLIVEASGMRFALAADVLEGIHSLDPLSGSAAMQASGRMPPFVAGLTGDLLTMIDLELLVADARFRIQGEVGG
ncbi:chemotaxis protein CheW [Ancylobacter pratisalsi]|uniref:Chemotaxis protein CheW n=1 Tax=Ancylobacter pratisalsi TaxID=1745854 RepID=A0A6P1YR68_9HYPH|nr:chemotaxis protein CheW [Ancylobacter pratisalsi]QIB34543.1 chemotaxis protein CheW [Ancylobacter pratisalsi]